MKATAPGLLVLLAGCATVPPSVVPTEHPAEYQCHLDINRPDNRFVADVVLAEDGALKTYHLIWLQIGQGWVMQFDFEGGRLPQASDDWSLLLTMSSFAPGYRTVRVDLLRGGNGDDSLALAGPRLDTHSWIMTRWGLNAVRTAIADAPVLIWRVTDRRRQVRLAPRIPVSALDGPRLAAAAHRAEIEAMVADYRNRCSFVPAGQDIVIT
jgi:hypothetical protein